MIGNFNEEAQTILNNAKKEMIGLGHPYIGTELVAWFNAPLQWDDTLTVDAYAHYQHSEHLGLDLIGTNLTNQYYLDPLTRSAVAAPGRAFKLALSYKF